MKKVIYLTIILLLFSACGRRQDDESDYVFVISTRRDITHTYFIEAADNLRNRLASEGVDVRFVIQTYLQADQEAHLERKLGSFAAGMGPDIFLRGNFLLYPFLEHGFIRDIHPLIEASENLSLDDFFINALRAYEIGGRLYNIPMTFGFDFVGINTNVPREFLNRFAGYSHISLSELAAIHNDLIMNDPKWGDFAFMNFGGGVWQFAPYINSAVDFNNRCVSFPDGTVEVLDTLRSAFENNNRFGTGAIFRPREESVQLLQERYVFFAPGSASALEALFDFQSTFFTDFIPISNLEGELIDTSSGIELVVSSSAPEWLATAFIEEMLNVTGNSPGLAPVSHIMRRYARQYMEGSMNRMLTQFTQRPTVETQANMVAKAADRLIDLGDLPIARPITHQYLPSQTFVPTLNSFMAGEINAFETVNQMEEGIMGFLTAAALVIVPYVPAPVVLERPHGTLKVMAPNTQTGVLEQAAEMMNASWQSQGIQNSFVLEVDDWDPSDWQGIEARMTRLGVELMAGGGPDIIISWIVGDIHSAADRGFLADINTLIENHPTSNRSDFFEHILDAVEINGGLYVFPVSFGFYRAGINTAIPQPFLQRFMGYESISMIELLDFYSDFMEMNSLDYGHLAPGTPTFMRFGLTSTVFSSIAPFIDFYRRISYINTPQFVDFLTSIKRALELQVNDTSGWTSNNPNTDFMRDRQQEYLFFTGTLRGSAAEAFLNRPEAFFSYFVPITDDLGNLIFNIRDINQTWATWSITNTGNSALAWEFLTYLLKAYYAPVGRAAFIPMIGIPTLWASESIATPIKRAHFENMTRRALKFTHSYDVGRKYAQGTPEWEQEIEEAIQLLAAQNEMPVVHANPMFPPLVWYILQDPLEQFQLGVITAEIAAQRIHNSITLWLLE